jgi:uncharacterized repeat protein (TIGR03803 family)
MLASFRSSFLAAGFVTLALSSAARAWDEHILYSFTGGTDGQQPSAGVVFDESGNLYGAAAYAGADQSCGPSGCGTIFKLTPAGAFSVLHNFNWTDGATPGGDLIRDEATGDLYGALFNGGAGGAGAVYRLAMDGTFTILHAYTDADGNIPEGRLVRDRKGNLYGTTYGGGTDGKGLVYKLSAKGKLTVLHSFTGGKQDGAFPTNAGLARDHAGNLFGMTQYGGKADYGTLFRVGADASFTLLHSFTSDKDGRYPASGLIIDRAGNLYGVTQDGGGGTACTYQCGTVFKMGPDGSETLLHAFTGGDDGSNPLSTLLRTNSGNLFGTTDDGSKGTLFELKPNGKEVVLHTFGAAGDGFEPNSGLTRANDGNLYGTTNLGGASGLGTVYVLTK